MTDAEKVEVVGLGGLHVIGTERHESRRIDNQLRGRSGRQGDPGSTRYFLSLEDNLFRIFGGDRIKWVAPPGVLSFQEEVGLEAFQGLPLGAAWGGGLEGGGYSDVQIQKLLSCDALAGSPQLDAFCVLPL